MPATDQEKRELWIPASDLLNGLELEVKLNFAREEPHIRIIGVLEERVGSVERMLEEWFPGKFAFRILKLRPASAPFPESIDVGVFARHVE